MWGKVEVGWTITRGSDYSRVRKLKGVLVVNKTSLSLKSQKLGGLFEYLAREEANHGLLQCFRIYIVILTIYIYNLDKFYLKISFLTT